MKESRRDSLGAVREPSQPDERSYDEKQIERTPGEPPVIFY